MTTKYRASYWYKNQLLRWHIAEDLVVGVEESEKAGKIAYKNYWRYFTLLQLLQYTTKTQNKHRKNGEKRPRKNAGNVGFFM